MSQSGPDPREFYITRPDFTFRGSFLFSDDKYMVYWWCFAIWQSRDVLWGGSWGIEVSMRCQEAADVMVTA